MKYTDWKEREKMLVHPLLSSSLFVSYLIKTEYFMRDH